MQSNIIQIQISKSHLPLCPAEVLERFRVWLCGAARKTHGFWIFYPSCGFNEELKQTVWNQMSWISVKAEGNDECSAVRHYDKRRKLSSVCAQTVSEVDPSRHILHLYFHTVSENTGHVSVNHNRNAKKNNHDAHRRSVCLMNRHHHADESVRCLLSHLCFGN